MNSALFSKIIMATFLVFLGAPLSQASGDIKINEEKKLVKKEEHIIDIKKDEVPKKKIEKNGREVRKEIRRADYTVYKIESGYNRWMGCACRIAEGYFKCGSTTLNLIGVGCGGALATGYLPSGWATGIAITVTVVNVGAAFLNGLSLLSYQTAKNKEEQEDKIEKAIINDADDEDKEEDDIEGEKKV